MSKTEAKRAEEEPVAVAVAATKRRMLVLKTEDNECFDVEESVAIQSFTIRNMVEEDCASDVIPLPNVTSKTLAKVTLYLQIQAHSNSSDSDQLFLQTIASNSPDEVIDLFLAANFLNIPALLNLISQKIADSIKSKKNDWAFR